MSAATRYVVVDESSAPELKGGALVTMSADIQDAYDEDFAPAHGVLPVEIYVRHPSEVQPGERVLHIVDSIPDAPGALAYHTVDERGNPVLRLGIEENRAQGGALLDVLSESISHEIFETAKNPFVNRYLDCGLDKKVADEVCDPAQGSPYRRGTTAIANFTLPAWSDAEDAEGPYDFVTSQHGRTVLTKPFDCAPTGYLAFDDGTQSFGDKVSDLRKEASIWARVPHKQAKT